MIIKVGGLEPLGPIGVYAYAAGLAFGGTGLCSCRVTGVDGSCAKHLTVESLCFMHMFMLLTDILIIISFPSPT